MAKRNGKMKMFRTLLSRKKKKKKKNQEPTKIIGLLKSGTVWLGSYHMYHNSSVAKAAFEI